MIPKSKNLNRSSVKVYTRPFTFCNLLAISSVMLKGKATFITKGNILEAERTC